MIAVLVLAFTGTSTISNGTVTPIRHVIVIMQENHSFDNYFGTYPTANGTLSGGVIAEIKKVNGLPNGTCLPYGKGCLSPYPANADNTESPIEGHSTYEDDYNSGMMDGFPTHSGPQSMAYFDYRQIPAYWDYAEEYGLAENYFASALSTTNPNRLLLLSGDSPVSENYGPPPYTPYNGTVLGQLSSHGISWGYFDYLAQFGEGSNVIPINYLSGLSPSALSNVQDISAFFGYLEGGGDLPAVNFVNAIGSDHLDEHPPSNVTAGEAWTVSLVNAIMCSRYWDSSAVFITYDEGGGYYDHVPPPEVLNIDHGFDRPLHGYGQRVPLLVISPYAKQNYVSDTLLNHMSLLRFVDYNWNLSPLNGNVANSNNLLDFFDFNSAPRGPIVLGEERPYTALSFPISLQPTSSQPINLEACSPVNQVSAPLPAYLSAIPVAIAAVVVVALLMRRKSRDRFTRVSVFSNTQWPRLLRQR
jgi:phospholipase C